MGLPMEHCREVTCWLKVIVNENILGQSLEISVNCLPKSITIKCMSLAIKHLTPLNTVSSVLSLSRVTLFVTPWTAAHQAFLSITNFQGLFKLMFIESVMPSNHLILCCLPSIIPSIRVFSNELALHIRWPKYWSFSVSISPSNEY